MTISGTVMVLIFMPVLMGALVGGMLGGVLLLAGAPKIIYFLLKKGDKKNLWEILEEVLF